MSRVVAFSQPHAFANIHYSSRCKTATLLKFTRSRLAAADFSRVSSEWMPRVWGSLSFHSSVSDVVTYLPSFEFFRPPPFCAWSDSLDIPQRNFSHSRSLTGKRIIMFFFFC